MKVGVLALQGAYKKHCEALTRLGIEAVEIRNAAQLQDLQAIVLPGGESTTMLKLMNEEHLKEPLREFAATRPTFGTCAGLILLAREVSCPRQDSLGILDIAVKRNGYGRQIDSFEAKAEVKGIGEMELVFIRAPIITAVGNDVEVLATHQGLPVLIRQGKVLGATFHPELTSDLRIHKMFLEMLS
ncbi:MAG: pyridoxal 5'-phosphate synthase glutaminase subunit PdxT [Acidobacteriota bacterium]|nr:pyridoxal 5'-phosphate synthase glutaminase subunit PdxT [Blastocatellia bacterium]MDW8412323.1 pyridoxal 5'-phosphate synthase glutaminase subunit PdxT [Acidobacteriota bacterium]